MNKPGFLEKIHKPEKLSLKKIVIIILLIGAVVMAGMFMFNGSEKVAFEVLDEGNIPQQMMSQIVPEYRQLERALACSIDDKIYVFACRGEKPTSGYEIDIKEMKMSSNDDMSKLTVYCQFKDPEPGNALTQAITYPYKIAETGLTYLPDEIELKVQYID